MKTLSMTAGAVAVAMLAGCASQPPAELKTARSTYQEVAQSPAVNASPADVYEAKKALDRAEVSFQHDGDSLETRDLAYIADRKAIIARSRANTVMASTQKQAALAELETWRQQQSMAMRQRLGEANKELAQSQQELESERQARIAAEQRTAAAFGAMKGMQAKQDARGLVLTITGGVLFATGKSELLPSARRALDDVVVALKTDARPILIVGHTDSVGSEESNQQLSQRRAESVRNYLATHGVPADRIQAQGMGEAQPIADNKSTEGRANNRRVEIILQGSAMGGPGQPGMGQPAPGGAQKGKQPGGTPQQPDGMQQPGGMQHPSGTPQPAKPPPPSSTQPGGRK
jgi:outer membrane protein OmpA-like peptidoglycan-associated protein